MRRLVPALALAAALLSAPARAGVVASLEPASQTVIPGSDFDVFLVVSEPGSPFNAFDAVVAFDSAALAPVPLAPLSLQEGALMTGACGNRFHRFLAAADRDSLTEVLLCAGVTVSGPGTVYRFRFHAGVSEQTTSLRLDRLRFYDAGILVAPVTVADATVTIASTVGVPAGVAPAPSLTLAPNPVRGAVSIRIAGAPAGAQELRVLDARGRVVAVLEHGEFPAGARTRSWNGAGASGERLPSGSYWLELRTAGRPARTRWVLLPG